MLGTQNCPNLHRYLKKEFYDGKAIKDKLISHFGLSEILQTEDEMKTRFGEKPKTIAEYLHLLDVMIAEDFHMLVGKSEVCSRLDIYEKQATFISANQLLGPDPDPAKVYVTRLVVPILQVLVNAQENVLNKKPDHLKYILLHAENMHIASLLDFLGFWEEFGYKKATTFASRVRFELIRKLDVSDPSKSGFFIQFSYDDEIIKFSWCNKQRDCPID